MRKPFTAFFALFVFALGTSQTAFAQSCPDHPTHSLAVVDTVFSVAVSLPSTSTSLADFDLAETESCLARGEICVWRLPNGSYEYYLTPESIEFELGCDAVDGYATSDLFGMLAERAVYRAIELGKSSCDSASSYNTKVWSAECVTRAGSGATTSFTTCSQAAMCPRTYAVQCTSSGGSVTYSGSSAAGQCSSSCESTCP